MWPDAMNAATRVKRPNVINSPVTTSMMPAYQTGQLPVGTLKAIGQLNTCDVPNDRKRNPNTTRNRLRTAGEYELRRDSTLLVMASTLRSLGPRCESQRRDVVRPGGQGSPGRTTRLPPLMNLRPPRASRNRAFP